MTKEYKLWRCSDPDCRNEVMSQDFPTFPVIWSDGHKCRYREIKENEENKTKGEK